MPENPYQPPKEANEIHPFPWRAMLTFTLWGVTAMAVLASLVLIGAIAFLNWASGFFPVKD